MRVHALAGVRIGRAEFETQSAVEIAVGPSILKDWCLALLLLREKEADRLELKSHRPEVRLTVLLCSSDTKTDELGVVREEPPGVTVTLPRRALDFLLFYFLRYYRDGEADVDHVDIEAVSVAPRRRSWYLTFRAERSAPPVSSDEARRRLGLRD